MDVFPLLSYHTIPKTNQTSSLTLILIKFLRLQLLMFTDTNNYSILMFTWYLFLLDNYLLTYLHVLTDVYSILNFARNLLGFFDNFTQLIYSIFTFVLHLRLLDNYFCSIQFNTCK